MNKISSGKRRKPDYDKAVPVSISLARIMLDRAASKASLKGFNGLSSYIQDLIRRDVFSAEHAA